jgi:DNA-binding NarL/FixJ family response regulator
VLHLIAGGMTDREVAQAMRVSLSRERYAVRDMITRLSAHNRAEAVYMAATGGLLAHVGEIKPDS